MNKTNSRYSNAGPIFHQINWCTYLLLRVLRWFVPAEKFDSSVKTSPVLICGLFRSGTTITARLLNQMGFSAGPEEDLLKGIGARKELNPEGFLENYFFMDLSLYIFRKTKSWGDAPPEAKDVENIVWKEKDIRVFAKFSIIKIHDDRINNLNKLRVHLKYNVFNQQAYLNDFFSGRSFIKNPHFSVLMPYVKMVFPDSPMIFIFKHPSAAVESAKVVSPNANYELYHSYYYKACEEHQKGNKNILFFSYEFLCVFPEFSVEKLANHLKVKDADINNLVKQLRVPEDKNFNDNIPDNVSELYDYMIENCVNTK